MKPFDDMTTPQMASVLRWGSRNRSMMLSEMCLRILKGRLVPGWHGRLTTVWCAFCGAYAACDRTKVAAERYFRKEGWRKFRSKWVCGEACGKKVTLPAQDL